ncbi:MAG: HupE/UreJ family protein [Pseudomonadota bacterium]
MMRAAWLLACILCLPAQAHLMAAGQGAVRLVGDSAFAVVSLPVAALAGFDDNRDGLLDATELAAHRGSISGQVSQLLECRDGDVAGSVVFEDLLLAHGDSTGEAELVVMRRYQWAAPLRAFNLGVHIFDTQASGNAQLLVRAIDGDKSELALLSRHSPHHDYFVGRWTSFANFVASGAEHILFGADHLLFLLTVLVVGASWRYWLLVVTSFTLAHSITLACAAFGWLQAPPRIVEPLIAASIVLMALDNLMRGRTALRHRPALVFACGLLHGLGIASALVELGLPDNGRILSLAGFNLGVEMGQLLFVGALLCALALARQYVGRRWHGRIVELCSLVAIVMGLGWVVERTFI